MSEPGAPAVALPEAVEVAIDRAAETYAAWQEATADGEQDSDAEAEATGARHRLCAAIVAYGDQRAAVPVAVGGAS